MWLRLALNSWFSQVLRLQAHTTMPGFAVPIYTPISENETYISNTNFHSSHLKSRTCTCVHLFTIPTQTTNPRKHSFHCFTVTLAWCKPIPPTLQLRFIDEEKLKATGTVICPFSPPLASFWAEWWLSNTGEQHKGPQDSSVVPISQKPFLSLCIQNKLWFRRKKSPTLRL